MTAASAQQPRVILRTAPPYADPISLQAVACPSTSLCVAVDHAGDVLTANGPNAGTWRVSNVDGVANLTSIACASVSFCAATDQRGNVVVSTAPGAGARAWHVTRADEATGSSKDLASTYLTSISCPSTGLCVAVDNRRNIVTSTSPAAHRPRWTTEEVLGAKTFSGVSCPSVSLCVAIDLGGDLAVSTNPAGGAGAWRLEPLPGQALAAPFPASLDANFLTGISCSSETLCVIATRAGAVLTSQRPAAGAGSWTSTEVDPRGGLDSVSCTSAPSFCAAVSNRGNVATSNAPAGGVGAWKLGPPPERGSIAGVSCAAPGQCAAVDFRGNVLASAPGAAWRLLEGVDRPRSPSCFGASERAPGRPCRGSLGRFAVVPTPIDAEITPNAPCAVIKPLGAPGVCSFGVPAPAATRTVALVGDSHALHWRAALEVVAQANAWQGVSVTTSGCPFSAGPLSISGRGRAACRRLMLHELIRWLRSQPEVSTVFVSQSVGSVPQHGNASLRASVAGYRRAWSALPASVRHVVVIRDTPQVNVGTLSCVEAELARHDAFIGRTCALPRAVALEPDPAAIAASETHSGRVQVIDMTHYICDQARCYPVVGGAMVYKDPQHITEVFSTTLGPYLGDALARLMAHWRH